MPQRSGLVTQLDQDRSVGEGPQNAYLMLVAGTYRLGYGKKDTEADAWLKDYSGVFKLDNDSAEEDTTMVYVSSTVYLLNG